MVRSVEDLLRRPPGTPLKDLPTPQRIAALPTLDPDPSTFPALVEKWTNHFHLDRPDRRPLRPLQALALEQMEWAAAQPGSIGTIANIPVGGGKSLAFLLAPKIFKAKRPLLLTKSSLRKNHEDQIWEWAPYYDFAPTRYERDPYYGRVVSYSQLSQPTASVLLKDMNPDVIFADECHLLRHPTSARTKRFLRFMKENPHVRFVAMTGTLSNSSVTDFAHLMYWALREYSPIPDHEHDLSLWGSVLNVKGEPDEYGWGALHAAEIKTNYDQDTARRNVRDKVSANVGTVMGTGMSTDMPLTLEAIKWEVSDDITDALRDLSEEWVLPDGSEVVDALAFHRALAQISVGYYYIWDWPGEPDEEWLSARREWWKACRDYLKNYSREYVDSPFLVEEYLRSTPSYRAPLLRQALETWDEQRHKAPPPTKPVWIDKSVVYQAVGTLFVQPAPTLLWFKSRAVGELVHQLGVETHWQDSDPVPGKHAALSINIHGTGRNYQAWHRSLFVDVETNGAKMEQALGRNHRQGQEHPVWAGINQSTWAQRQQWMAMMDKARYAHNVLGALQKVIWGTKEGF